jgi:ribA/ribD-fused uncharacterized protein
MVQTIRSEFGIRYFPEKCERRIILENETNLRIYNPENCAVFCKTKERFGGNSNMAGGFPLLVNEVKILTSEALYQACRFPYNPEIQKNIIAQRSPMTAKMVGKPFRETLTRQDWNSIRVTLMRWCLRVKLLQNWDSFRNVLLETGEMPIVELSSKGDDFWGAVVVKELEVPEKKHKKKTPKYLPSLEMPPGFLVGFNVLGRLNMELRENVKTGRDPMSNDFTNLPPLPIKDFLLLGEPIREIVRR